MATTIPSPRKRIPIERLTPAAFSPFGTVVQNPDNATSQQQQQQQPPIPSPLPANHFTALKYPSISPLTSTYPRAPSGLPATPSVTLFHCFPRHLRAREPSQSMPSSWGDIDMSYGDEDEDAGADGEEGGAGGDVDFLDGAYNRQLLDIKILERHAYTTQMFVPLGLAPHRGGGTHYLVVVAPTRLSSCAASRPPPSPSPSPSPPLPNPPDLPQIRAFLATGAQAVTYHPGTWHAPMIVIGDRPVDFVVVQYANGVDGEDCEEVVLASGGGGRGGGGGVAGGGGSVGSNPDREGIVVSVDTDSSGSIRVVDRVRAGVKAKL